MVLDYAEDLVAEVMAGDKSLATAAETARERKKARRLAAANGQKTLKSRTTKLRGHKRTPHRCPDDAGWRGASTCGARAVRLPAGDSPVLDIEPVGEPGDQAVMRVAAGKITP